MPSAFIHYTCYKSHPLDTILKRAFFWDTLLSQKLPLELELQQTKVNGLENINTAA